LSLSYSENTNGLVGNLIDILRYAAPTLMVAVGMSLVIATAGIDLSVGSGMVVGGAVSMEFLAANSSGSLGDAALAVVLAVLVAGSLGLINAILISSAGLQPFISTLIMMMAGRGLAKVITGGNNTYATNDHFKWISTGYVLGLPVVAVIAFVIAILVGLLVRRTALGLMIESIGIDAEAARLAGISKRAILFTVYIASAMLAGVAGIFTTANVMTVDVTQTGSLVELDAILAVVIGGTSLAGGKFSIRGAMVGALLIATLDKTVVFLGVAPSATPAFKAIVIIALSLLQARGFLAEALKRRQLQKVARQAKEVAA
jgi:simple sugar transport system permease protein